MNALEKLKSVLCSPDGEVCVHGSEEDRRIISEALSELQSAQQPAPVAQKVLCPVCEQRAILLDMMADMTSAAAQAQEDRNE